jgi:type II secretory pathway pseudopilin PulG
MPTRIIIRFAEILIALSLAAIIFAAWRADRHDQATLSTALAAAKQSMAQADARQHDRDTQLLKTLATLAAQKKATTTPTQIVRDLPNQLPLPAPITLQLPTPSTPSSNKTCRSGLPWFAKSPMCGPQGLESNPSPDPAGKLTGAVIPAADLKPFYDFTLDCKACQAKLAAAQSDLTDEQAKAIVLTKERDEAVHAAKGGGVLRRIARNAKWLAIGAAAGAIAAKVHR